jgi:hypothetical protein
MKSILYTSLTLAISMFLFSACGNDASLQKYIVEKQNDNDFITLDIPSSLILTDNNNLNEEHLKTIKSIKKVNVLALQLKEDNKARYEIEKERVKSILSNDKYETLMKYGSNDMGATLMFTGDVDAINELIIFASDEEKGFGLFRVIGDKMNPSQVVKLMDNVNSNNFDFSFMNNLGSLLN